jgi:hypothetical protein
MSVPRKILIVFDIDETLIQFVQNKQDPCVFKSIEANESLFDIEKTDKGDVIIYRPYLGELFEFIKENNTKLQAAIWTYSDADYAKAIGNGLTKKFNLPKNFFLFKYSEDETADLDYDKDLNFIWDDEDYGDNFNKFNTFLVDDRDKNLMHSGNLMNSILIKPFAPFGPEKTRVVTSSKIIEEESKDDVFLEVIKICDTLIKDVDGCTDDEVSTALKTENVFNIERVNRMGLGGHLKSFNVGKKGTFQIMTIGKPHLSPGTTQLGGRHTRKHRKHMRKTNKGRKIVRRRKNSRRR